MDDVPYLEWIQVEWGWLNKFTYTHSIWGPASLLSNGYRWLLPRVKLTTHHLVPRSRMMELYLHSPTRLHGSCLINHSDNFTLHTLTCTYWWCIFLCSVRVSKLLISMIWVVLEQKGRGRKKFFLNFIPPNYIVSILWPSLNIHLTNTLHTDSIIFVTVVFILMFQRRQNSRNDVITPTDNIDIHIWLKRGDAIGHTLARPVVQNQEFFEL
jgi:hypothetical protein